MWQLLLGYLPPDQRKWEATLQAKRAEYARFCKVKVFIESLQTVASPVWVALSCLICVLPIA